MGVEEGVHGERETELEFRVEGGDCFALAVSERADCRLELRAVRPRSDGDSLVVFEVEGADPARVCRLGERVAGVEEGRPVRAGERGGVVQFVFAGSGVTTTLADAGAVARSVRLAAGEGQVVAVTPPTVPAREVVETVTDRHPGVALVACRRRVGGRADDRDGATGLLDRLTDRQEEAVRTAYDDGYFEWPREATAEECARALGVAQPTFSQHLRTGERKLLDGLLGGPDEPVHQS